MTIIISSPNKIVRDVLEKFNSDVEIVDWDLRGPAPVKKIDMVVTPLVDGNPEYRFLEDVDFTYLQCSTLGYEAVLPYLGDHHILANAKTVHETSTAELTLTLTLAMQRQVPRSVKSQAAGTWDTFYSHGLADKRVVLIGVGGVGTAIAQRLAPFEVDLVRVGRTERDDADGHIFATSQLPQLLPDADIVIVIVPATDETRALVDDEFLSLLKDDALVVNMARGVVADTDAMVKHADRLRFAFDVVDPEPLPAGHVLYTHPNVLISAHNGGYSQALAPRLERLIERQVRHLFAGEELENIIRR
ncbi:NAD(P)-dependent oxidoreductase [Arcanobacterium pinnipediorum]|uniref:NAD(P)-binding domain-containing protein n=1 Tax=Arcanobacterium pinnipediorum TaxID=1503041 RepID=A0ABY5AJ55_9ACTO|nr:NAD(P)-dependent oxidoreductase [Arcanobacterium pinnipediorum]USR80001.1 NAD(P)-binding domain-containing protein [Arcanobacterium pinnipediorum]